MPKYNDFDFDLDLQTQLASSGPGSTQPVDTLSSECDTTTWTSYWN